MFCNRFNKTLICSHPRKKSCLFDKWPSISAKVLKMLQKVVEKKEILFGFGTGWEWVVSEWLDNLCYFRDTFFLIMLKIFVLFFSFIDTNENMALYLIPSLLSCSTLSLSAANSDSIRRRTWRLSISKMIQAYVLKVWVRTITSNMFVNSAYNS